MLLFEFILLCLFHLSIQQSNFQLCLNLLDQKIKAFVFLLLGPYSTLCVVINAIPLLSPSQSLHKDGSGLCEQQRERCVCPQQHSPHLPGGGQPHHGLWRHFTSALCRHLFLCESLCVFNHVGVYVGGFSSRKLSIHIDLFQPH